MIPSAFVGYDNTPHIANGTAITGVTPDKFEMYMEQLLAKPNETGFSPIEEAP